MRYTRLGDREMRNGKDLGRKQVFLGEGLDEKFVEMRFSANYAPLYLKTLAAFENVSPRFIGKLLEANDENFTLRVQFLGKSLEPVRDNLSRIVHFLKEFNNSTQDKSKFKQCRYLSSLAEQTHNQTIITFAQNVNSMTSLVQTGNGIDDPVVSNFTEDESGVHVVDLDHFSNDHSLYYQVGFVMADVDILSGLPLSQKTEVLLDRCKEYGSFSEISSQEVVPLTVGYISRLGIDIINNDKGLDSYRSTESLESILSLASEISKNIDQFSSSSSQIS